MTDVHTRQGRSFNMKMIRSKDTKPELTVRRYLHAKGLRYSLHKKDLPGKPDLVFLKYKTVVFINGCFWHGHYGCKYFVVPQTRKEWWLNKIQGNKINDHKNSGLLEKLGWNVVIVWECELTGVNSEKNLVKIFHKITLSEK